MKKPITAATTKTSTILSVSSDALDHSSLESILGGTGCTLLKADSLTAGVELLKTHVVAVVICERDLCPGTWIDLLEYTKNLHRPPALIVTSRLADEYLWSLALHLTAWDVLPKPFDRHEVARTVHFAWEYWHHQVETAPKQAKVMTATG